MERKITLTYNWTRNDGDGEVLEHHKEALEESALDRMAEQLKDGMYCGELYDTIILTESDGDGVEYRGWWSSENNRT